jgi:hypothetical protein
MPQRKPPEHTPLNASVNLSVNYPQLIWTRPTLRIQNDAMNALGYPAVTFLFVLALEVLNLTFSQR